MIDASAQWITFLTLIIVTLFQVYRENRAHRWEQEAKAEIAAALVKDKAELAANVLKDKKELEDKLAAEASRVAAVAVNAAAHVAAQVVVENAKLASAIADNTDISTKAFHEANSVNLKIAAIGMEHNALQRALVNGDKKPEE